MKKRSLLIFSAIMAFSFIFTFLSVMAQSERKVIVEDFTNGSCGPCAAYNPLLQPFLFAHLDKIIPVFYHSNFPGVANTDPMYVNDPSMNDGRLSYYSVVGVPTTKVQGNAYTGTAGYVPVIADVTTAYNNVIAKGESPITISITKTENGSNVTVDVTVTATQAFPGLRLRIAAVEPIHHYDNAGTNGEKDFYFIARKMLPDFNGTAMSLFPGTPYHVQQAYTNKAEWNASTMFIAVWLQDDGTREIVQANSTPIPSPVTVTLSCDNPYLKIPNSIATSNTVTLTNNTDFDYTVGLSVSSTSYIPTGWNVTIDQPTVTVPANGGTANINTTITSTSDANFSIIVVNAIPTGLSNSYFPIPTTIAMAALTNNTKNVVWMGYDDAGYAYTLSSLYNYNSQQLKSTSAFIPLSSGYLQNYPPKSFDLGIFSADYNGRGIFSTTQLTDHQPTLMAIEDMLNNNKKVLITSEVDLSISAGTTGSYIANDFFNNILGIQPSGNPKQRVTINQNGQLTGLLPYPINGVSGDEIGNGISLTANNITGSNISYGRFTILTDVIKLNTGSTSTAFIYTDNNTNNIAGIHFEKDLSRLVYMTTGFGAIYDDIQRDKIMSNILNWLEAAPSGAKISTVSTSYVFDDTRPGSTTPVTIEVNNTGNQNLVITSINISQPVFTLGPNITFPITVAPGNYTDLIVNFSPTEVKNYTGIMTINSNALDQTQYGLALIGAGIAGTGKFISSDAPNNKVDFGKQPILEKVYKNLTIKNDGTQSFTITLIDFSANDDGVYTVESGGETPVTLARGDTKVVSVSFMPGVVDKVYNGTLTILSNATNLPVYSIDYTGIGDVNASVYEPSVQSGVLTMSVSPNPISDNGIINYTISGNESVNINLNLVDVTGRIITNLLSGTRIPGDYQINVNANSYSNGTYFIVGSVGTTSVQLPLMISK